MPTVFQKDTWTPEIHYMDSSSLQLYEIGTVPISQMRELRLRRIKNMSRVSQLAGNDRGKNHPRKIHPTHFVAE